MRIHIITLFPDIVGAYCQSSILGRAQQKNAVTITCVNPRDFTHDGHHKVDDTPYGGGPGMVMMCEPLMAAYESLLPLSVNHQVLLTSPWGQPFQQATAQALTQLDDLVIICGHYEGIDARIIELIPNLSLVSLGDFVMTGGELAAMAVTDAVVRLLPDVLIKAGATDNESFSIDTETGCSASLLEYPHYTRPASYRGLEVPDVLLYGNHKAIAEWRQQQANAITKYYRPDLLSP